MRDVRNISTAPKRAPFWSRSRPVWKSHRHGVAVAVPQDFFVAPQFITAAQGVQERVLAGGVFLKKVGVGPAQHPAAERTEICRRVEMGDIAHYVNTNDPVIHAFENAAQVDLDFFLLFKAFGKLFVFSVQFNIDVFKVLLHVIISDAQLLGADLKI